MPPSAVVVCRVAWSPLADRPELRALLDGAERARYAGLELPADRARFVTGRALARTALGRMAGLPPELVRFDRKCRHCGSPHGKPRVPGVSANFSLSHSGERVALAVAEGAELGVDVERMAGRSVERLAPRVLSPEEFQEFQATAPRNRIRAFYTYWTRKEALLKAVELGITAPKRGITVSGPEAEAELLAWEGMAGPGAPEFFLCDLDPGPGYSAALAVQGPGAVKVTERGLVDPLDEF